VCSSNDYNGVAESVACPYIQGIRFVDAAFPGKGDRIVYYFIVTGVESVRLAPRGAKLCYNSIWIKDSSQLRVPIV
jgi:hypothetical protein